MKMSPAELKQLVGKQFEFQRPMLNLYQTLADHFYPERADFTQVRNVGSEMADNLLDSSPVVMRRDLGNALSAMLRDGDWFDLTSDPAPDYDSRDWLEWAAWRMRKMMQDRKSGFSRATKEGDHDFVTFGQTVISVEINRLRNGMLYRAWHLRDCAWWCDETGQVSGVARKWKTNYRQAVDYFGRDNVAKEIAEEVDKTPFKDLELYHLCMPSDMYRDDEIASRFEYVSIYLDLQHDKVIEEVGLPYQMYVVPRFQTISGSAYAYSPAAIIALPNARALQAMTHTLLEAAERYARPPILATQKAIRSDVDLKPDGITWVDQEYDERMGAALRPMFQDRGGYPIGKDAKMSVVDILRQSFFLDTINLPDMGREMTAYEVSERMKQFRRQNLPLFAPMEDEYNGQLCEKTFEVAMRYGLLGSPQDIPDSLRGAEVKFQFQSPLSRTEEEERAQRFQQVSSLLAEAAQFDPDIVLEANVGEAFRDAVVGLGAPVEWLNDPEEVQTARQAKAAAAAAMQALQVQQEAAALQQGPGGPGAPGLVTGSGVGE